MTVPVHGLPPMLLEGMEVALVPPALKGSRWHHIVSVDDEGGSGQLVALSGVNDIGGAQQLVGKVMLASVESLSEDYSLHDVDALLGRCVVDVAAGPLGTIDEILTGPANDVWVVQGGPFGEVLLPVIDDVVREVSPSGAIEVTVPAGILPAGKHQEGVSSADSSCES